MVLNKIDLVDAAQRESVRGWVRQIAPQARILDAVQSDVPLELLLGVGRFRALLEPAAHDHDHDHDHEHHDHAHDHDHSEHDHEHHDHAHHDHKHHDHEHHDHDHSDAFSTWSYTADQPFALHALRAAILDLPTSVFRAKGVITLAEAPLRRVVFQLVGARANVVLSEPWGDEAPRTQLVLIGTPGGVDGDALQQRFDACLAAPVLETAVGDQSWTRGGTP